MLTALNFPHVRALDARQVRQGFLGDAVLGAQAAHGIAKGPRRARFKRLCAGWPPALNSLLLQTQKRRVSCLLKPRYL